MLSRIAQGLYGMGRSVERIQNVTRILEVNHKMSLERSDSSAGEVWAAIAHSFLCPIETYSEEGLYSVLVFSNAWSAVRISSGIRRKTAPGPLRSMKKLARKRASPGSS